MKKIAYSKSSLKVLRKMPANDSARILSKINQYAADPKSQANNIKKLTGSEYIRLRVGDWRVIMDDQGDIIAVVKIGPRGGVY